MIHRILVGLSVLYLVGVIGCTDSEDREPRPLTIVSAAIVEPGTPTSVPQYEKVEILVEFEHGYITKPYDPAPANGGCNLRAVFTAPGGAVWNINGFYDGANWRIRFAPDTIGLWSYTVTATDKTGTDTLTGGAFTCVAGTNRGWLRINGRYLQTTTGETVVPIGHNNGWQYDVEVPSFSSMASRGENLMSFWLTVPWADPTDTSAAYWTDRAAIDPLQNGIGTYNPAACRYIDGVFSRAEAAGVYLLPTLWSHGQLRDSTHPWSAYGYWWGNNVYSSVTTPDDFFKTSDAGADTVQWRYQKDLYRYIIARWGHSTALAGWVFLCEAEGTNGWVNNRSQLEAWCGSIHDYFAAHDKYRLNAVNEFPGVATRSDDVSSPNAPDTWDTGMDMRARDSYAGKNVDTAVAAEIGDHTRNMWETGDPCFHTEFGGDVDHGATQPVHLHNGVWPGITSGACMAPLLWCDGGSWPLLTEEPTMRDHLEYLSQFCSGVTDWPAYTHQISAIYSGAGSATAYGWGIRSRDEGVLWSFNLIAAIDGTHITIPGLDTGRYRVSWFDANTSCVSAVRVDTIDVLASDLVLTAPDLLPDRKDVAVRFVRTGATPSPVPTTTECP